MLQQLIILLPLLLAKPFFAGALPPESPLADASAGRERISLNAGWKFRRFTSNPDSLSYDALKPWILPQGNDFIVDGAKHRPPSEEDEGPPPGADVEYVQASLDDGAWETVDLPHDWAIKGPFNAPGISGGMGRLPTDGVGWYRRNVTLAPGDRDRSVFLDVDGAMSYAAVWLNGRLVGGWPYGYASFRLDLTPHLRVGDDNLLAVRLDNARDNSRWYPGAGLYRNVWLVKASPVHVGQSGTFITTPQVSNASATVHVVVEVENTGNASQMVDVVTEIRPLVDGNAADASVARVERTTATVAAGAKMSVNGSAVVARPLLWGPRPAQTPHLYVATTTLLANSSGADRAGAVVVDRYETRFGIRTIEFDGDRGVLVNGQVVPVQGTCLHHDHGSLGAAFHARAAERQLETMQEMGSNAVRTSHNPPAPELLDLADRLGMLVVDEIFDCWDHHKTANDFQRIFTDWHEPDLRAFLRRDRNHPSVMAWSFGNEVAEQSSAAGGNTARRLRAIVRSEDASRPTTVAMNSAGAGSALAAVLDVEGLNYQGEGLGTSTAGSFASFHRAFPAKVIWSSESSSALSTRGTYLFPVTAANSATVGSTPGAGGDPTGLRVSAYELYATSWGSSPDKVFAAHDRNPYVAGEFVWSGFDYLGEPTPYDGARGARSSYFGIVDLAGFKKDRFYLYQSRWRPDLPAAHILPHWSWPAGNDTDNGRAGQTTPVHVFSAADEAELFVNGVSAGRLRRAADAYRFRWDRVVYQPGNLSVVTYKDGKEWATDSVATAGEPARLNITADRTALSRGSSSSSTTATTSSDLSFVTVAVVDARGRIVPSAANEITFSVSGPARLVSTDNGDPADMTAFPSPSRKAFSGLALAVVRVNASSSGDGHANDTIVVSAAAAGLTGARVTLQAT